MKKYYRSLDTPQELGRLSDVYLTHINWGVFDEIINYQQGLLCRIQILRGIKVHHLGPKKY